jgi:hypothetical protein
MDGVVGVGLRLEPVLQFAHCGWKFISRRNGEVCQQFGDPLRVKVV